MTIIYSEERKKHHQFDVNDVMNYGMIEACILGNIHLFSDYPRDQLHKGFPYAEPSRFYEYLEELIEKGLLKEI